MHSIFDRFRVAILSRGSSRDRAITVFAAVITILVCAAYVVAGLRPVSSPDEAREVAVAIPAGTGLRGIADILDANGILRSPAVFKLAAVLWGDARDLKAGSYVFRTDEGVGAILHKLVQGAAQEIEVRIPEGATSYDIDDILASQGVLGPGAFVTYIRAQNRPIEGRLFPDTYRFFTGADSRDVLEKFLANFSAKARPLLASSKDPERDLVIASLLEREVPDYADRRIVAGILKKRVAAGMPLQVDATVCYAKEMTAGRTVDCLPFADADFKIDSPYNTYLYKGMPPGPIGNPGIEAIKTAMNPAPSSYWYYLSDPKTKRTIFSKTFEEHVENRARYLQ